MEFLGLFLHKDSADAKPLYYQLYSYLVGMVRSGALPAGERLPGKRTLAAQLGVSVNTADTAYQMLAAEGYIWAKPRSGFFVCRLEQLVPPPGAGGVSGHTGLATEGGLPSPAVESTPPVPVAGARLAALPHAKAFLPADEGKTAAPPTPAGAAAEEASTPYSAAPSFIAPNALPFPAAGRHGSPARQPYRYSFASGDIDTGLFPHKTWGRLAREVLANEPGLFGAGEANGDAALREAIAIYLRGYRGVRCGAEQLVVGAGLEVLLGMLARLFPTGIAAVETPGYPKTVKILQNAGAAMRPVPVDENGMPPSALAASGADIAYLTPSHQFPTGGVMPVGRRTALLGWAAQGERLLVEDDYDSEFRFDGRPLPSLQGLDTAGRVVYAGTFSRSLAPGLRVAYLVLPPAVLARWQAAYGDYACTVPRPEQHTLARFMAEGHFSRSLNRMRGIYKRRRGLLLQTLQQHLPPGSFEAQNTHTGLYFILRLPGQAAVPLAQKAREGGIRIRALDEYRIAPGGGAAGLASTSADALLLGYGGLSDAEAEPAVQALAEMISPG